LWAEHDAARSSIRGGEGLLTVAAGSFRSIQIASGWLHGLVLEAGARWQSVQLLHGSEESQEKSKAMKTKPNVKAGTVVKFR